MTTTYATQGTCARFIDIDTTIRTNRLKGDTGGLEQIAVDPGRNILMVLNNINHDTPPFSIKTGKGRQSITVGLPPALSHLTTAKSTCFRPATVPATAPE